MVISVYNTNCNTVMVSIYNVIIVVFFKAKKNRFSDYFFLRAMQEVFFGLLLLSYKVIPCHEVFLLTTRC
jgi:hypothetical protein